MSLFACRPRIRGSDDATGPRKGVFRTCPSAGGNVWTQRCLPASTEPFLHDLRLRAVLVQMNGMGLSSESSRVSSTCSVHATVPFFSKQSRPVPPSTRPPPLHPTSSIDPQVERERGGQQHAHTCGHSNVGSRRSSDSRARRRARRGGSRGGSRVAVSVNTCCEFR